MIATSQPARPGQPVGLASGSRAASDKLPGLVRVSLVRGLIEIKQFARQRENVIFTFSLPIILLLLFGQIFHGEVGHTGVSFRQYFIAGIIASGLMSATFVGVGVSIAADRDDGTLTRLAGTPLPPAAYFAGKAILAFVTAVLEVAALLAVGVAVLGLHLPATPERWLTLAWVLVRGQRDMLDARHRARRTGAQHSQRVRHHEPAVPGAVVYFGCLLRVLPPASRVAARRRDLPAQVDLPGPALGVPAGPAARGGAGPQLGARQDRTGARHLARRKLGGMRAHFPVAAAG